MGVLFIQLIMHLNKETPLQRGKYIIESVLGQGSFGITYLATTKFQGTLGDISVKVAIKEFFARDLNLRHPGGTVAEVSSGSLSGKYARDFQREAKNLSSLKHPNIINVLESFSENNTHYYVMEYLDGGNLDDYIHSKGQLSESEALDIASQMAQALSYMHSHNMLHLDLKPKNVMRRSDGTICLIDFGLSKQYESSGEPESSTTIGLGTPGYAPLEQGSSDERKNFAPTLDIYALGASVFKMVTGKTPPRASDIMNDGFPSDELAALGISSATISTIERMMSPRKKDRPQSVEECGLGSTDIYIENKSSLVEETDIPEEKTNIIAIQDSVDNNNKPVSYKLLAITFMTFVILFVGIVAFSGYAKYKKENDRNYYSRTLGINASYDQASRILTVNGVEYPMVYVKGGSFTMGSDSEEAFDDEKPPHRVRLGSYCIGKYEVTQDLWTTIMGDNSMLTSFYGGLRKPAACVSWNECQEFIIRLNRLTGQSFSLPTEAQWEFAAIGGINSRGYKYPGSNELSDVVFSDSAEDHTAGDNHEVGITLPNELGIYDMAGNVLEWCSDWYGRYDSSNSVNPKGPKTGNHRVIRGGSCGIAKGSNGVNEYLSRRCRVSNRKSDFPYGGNNSIGFRLCL